MYSRMRRAGALACVVLAAGASIATSKPRWTLHDRATTHVTLDDARPKQTVVLTVESSHSPNVDVPLLVTWDSSAKPPRASLRVAITADDGSAPFSASVSPFFDPAGKPVPSAKIEPPSWSSRCKPACRIRYTIELERAAGAGESVSIDASAVATIGQDDETTPPPTAAVRARFGP
jgi:hypothetical protein